ncbi:MAG: Ni/Fe hydrogenase subunit alpha [Anaerolineales bacterium]|nr:Ni/Fe hydrogenase subunit alpha [Anaerolineales bacterium]MCA9975296.1 Ni/Fe hydrogenase subunit alpha [Anaerolineales bacterium]
MTKVVTIDPVTRIEGHAKITIQLDEQNKVADARFHVTEFRGFEKFCEGRSFWEMPGITARICGICPVSHLMASSKAGDAILNTRLPDTAVKLRRLMNFAQYTQSHALSFFHLSAPDLLLGMESDPGTRHVVGLLNQYPDIARAGIRLRQFGQDIIRMLGGKSVHPAWTVPGGVREPLSVEDRDEIRRRLPEAFDTTHLALDLLKDSFDAFAKEADTYGDFPSLYLGLVAADGSLEHYDGFLRVVDSDGKVLVDKLEPERYQEIIGEAVEPWSYLKFPYYKPYGYPGGMYRVGPLARLNVCDFAGMPRADRELRQFRRLGKHGRPVSSSFHYHYARLIEILFALEHIEALVEDPGITRTHIRSWAGVNQPVGIGVSEAPRGTLFHHYKVNQQGILEKVNLIVATGQNNLAMNHTVKQIAQAYVNGSGLTEGILNRIEHGIRVYDPCLSCSTHAIGQMPLHVQLVDGNGRIVDEIKR